MALPAARRPPARPAPALRRIARRAPAPASASPSSPPPPPPPTALLLECDGVVVDTAADVHRAAFNAAFKELGMDCARWSAALYADLVRTGDGTGTGLVATYFNTVGWPQMLATADRGPFADRVHSLKLKHAARIVADGDFDLRPGVRDVIDDALAAGARVALLGGTAALDGVADAARRALGSERDVAVFNLPDGGDDGDGGGGSDDDAPPASYEASFAAAAAKVKSSAAAAFVKEMAAARAAGGGGGGDGLVIDQSLLAAAGGRGGPAASPQWLAAVAAALGVPCAGCAVVAARSGLLTAARGAGMVACAAPPRSGARGTGEFPTAHAVCDGFGAGGGVTWRKLAALMEREALGR